MNELEDKKIAALEAKLEKLTVEASQDNVTKRNHWKPKKIDSLNKKAMKKPEYVLVQYLRNNHMMDFQLTKIVSGNIIVINNKGHKLNPRMVWRHGKYFWYIVAEWDTEPIYPRFLDKIRKLQRNTDNHPILMKMVLGAVEKKQEIKNKKTIGWVIAGIAALVILYVLFGGH
jgi:hypothetical protein